MLEQWLPNLDPAVAALHLSDRTEWAVQYNRLTLDDLRQTSDEVLCRCDYLGPGRVREIRRAFAMREADLSSTPHLELLYTVETFYRREERR